VVMCEAKGTSRRRKDASTSASAADLAATKQAIGARQFKKAEDTKYVDLGLEFGGPRGVCAVVFFSHVVVYFLWWCLQAGGELQLPTQGESIPAFFARFATDVAILAGPTKYGFTLYISFIVMQAVLAVVLPGHKVEGFPLPSRGGERLSYICNGVGAWYTTLAVFGTLHFANVWRLTEIIDNIGPITTAAVITSNVWAVALWAVANAKGTMETAKGLPIYDIFMGVVLNPRATIVPGFPPLDIKMWSETRVPWIMLFLTTTSCAAKQYDMTGAVSAPMAFMVLAHALYANACAKGEECVPTTWDIFHEKWGWMLAFWNMCGVPLSYCTSSIYILRTARPVLEGVVPNVALYATLLLAYWVWDTANYQKNAFRMRIQGTHFKRKAFPQLPWMHLKNPSFLTTKQGGKLLTDGWWKYARKPHYMADVVMALTWGLCTGFGSPVPYWYFLFFSLMITHRTSRDTARCAQKYGADWVEYTKVVPYVLVPGVY